VRTLPIKLEQPAPPQAVEPTLKAIEGGLA
jgi:hypothetical protein